MQNSDMSVLQRLSAWRAASKDRSYTIQEDDGMGASCGPNVTLTDFAFTVDACGVAAWEPYSQKTGQRTTLSVKATDTVGDPVTIEYMIDLALRTWAEHCDKTP